jgi:hypothetical protein
LSNTFDIDQLVSLIADRYPHWQATPAGLQRLVGRLDPGRHRPVKSRPELLTRLGLIEYLRNSADGCPPDVIDAGAENLSVDDPTNVDTSTWTAATGTSTMNCWPPTPNWTKSASPWPATCVSTPAAPTGPTSGRHPCS